MKLKRFEAEIPENSNACKTIPFVKKAGSVLGAGAMAVLAVGAVGIYAFVGGNNIPSSDTYAADAEKTTQISQTEETTSQPEQSVSQVAATWRKAGIEEYDLVIETVKATETTTTKQTTTTTTTTTEETTTTTPETTTTSATTTTPETTTTKKTSAKTTTTKKTETTAEKSEAASEEVKACSVRTMYTNDKVNMRKGPSLDDDVITVLASGTELTVTGYTDNWYRIKYDGKVGYCMKKYADSEKPETAKEETADTDSTESTVSSGAISCTDEEFNMLCYVLQGEVGDCSQDSKLAVANVIINRVKSPNFPDTISGVLTQSNQFTAIYGYYNGTNTPTQDTIDCARRAVNGEDNSNGAVYYYAPSYCGGSTAAWFETLTFCMELDGQRYFK
jgi:spore germination cell wall hydrolase CwlJ-like protein